MGKRKKPNQRGWKKQIRKKFKLSDGHPLYVPSEPSCELSDEEKVALYAQAVTVGNLPVTTVKQPFSSAFFVPDPEERKDIEWRKIRLEHTCIDSDYPFCAIVTDTKTCPDCPKCFYKKSIKEAEEKKDPSLLTLKACAKEWYRNMAVLQKNNCKPLSGYPSNCIPGILLFAPDTESNRQEDEEVESSWDVSKKWGKHGWKVKKVIIFAEPIL